MQLKTALVNKFYASMQIFIINCICFCTFYICVIFINYALGLDIARFCIKILDYFINSGNFSVYIITDKWYEKYYINSFASMLNFILIAIISFVAYFEYFLYKRFYLAYFLAALGFMGYFSLHPYSVIYYAIAYFCAFCFALLEAKMLFIFCKEIK